MPWKGVTMSEQRQRFLEDYLLNYYSISELAERFSISRTTAHKWIRRLKRHGQEVTPLSPRLPPDGSPKGTKVSTKRGPFFTPEARNGNLFSDTRSCGNSCWSCTCSTGVGWYMNGSGWDRNLEHFRTGSGLSYTMPVNH
jgi:hypothetical protein